MFGLMLKRKHDIVVAKLIETMTDVVKENIELRRALKESSKNDARDAKGRYTGKKVKKCSK